MVNFCTLYNSAYSARGLAMYHSLCKHCPSFHLYVFAFDDLIEEILTKMALPNVTIVTLKEFEDERLLAVKPTRTAGEYCWTCSGSTILYCIEHFNLDACTYIDADLYFYSDPTILINEMGDDDVLITEHRYSKQFEQSVIAGKYCVQFMTFKNTPNGLKVLNWWRNKCIEWCYGRYEEGKFGDQKYLDDWTTRFTGIHELQHLGGGVAPWNAQQYIFERKGEDITGTVTATGEKFKLVFYHFHYLKSYKRWRFRELVLSHYQLPHSVLSIIYKPHIKDLINSYYENKLINGNIDGLATQDIPYESIWMWLRLIISRVRHRDFRYKYWIENSHYGHNKF